jgi:hypothetical protein
MPDTIMSSTNFSHFFANFRLFVSSKRSSDDEMYLLAKDSRNTCSLSCQNSFSRALSRNGKLRTWLTKI